MASTRIIAKGVQISPAGSVKERRHCASTVARVYVPGKPRSRHCDGVRASGSAEVRVHKPVVFANVVIGSNLASFRVKFTKFVL